MTFGSEYIKILESYQKEMTKRGDGNFGVDYESSYTNIKMACVELAKIYIGEKRVTRVYPNLKNKLWKTFIPIEVNDYDRKMFDGIVIEVVCMMDSYFNINIYRASRPTNLEYMKPCYDENDMEIN